MTKKKPKMDRMESIVSAAVDEFLQNGYEKASMAAIAGRAGISKGGLYHHFASKQELLLYANQKLSEPLTKLMARARRQPSANAGLRRYIHEYLAHWQQHPRELVFFFLAMTRILESKNLWQYYEEFTERTICFFQELLERGVATGEFGAHDTRSRAVVIMAALDGVIGYLVIDPRLPRSDAESGIVAVLIDAVDRSAGKGKQP
jgi:AcrR family transcriptional regulator